MPKVVDQEAYRRELVEGAIQLFSERGYGSVTMREVARELGVSTGTVYHYFDSKQKLFEAVVRSVIDGHVAGALASFAAVAPGEGPRVDVRGLLMFLVSQEERLMSEFVVMMDYWRLHPEERAELRDVLAHAHTTYAELVASLLGSDNMALGELVLSVLFNILEMRWFHGPEFDYEPQLVLLERLVEIDA